MKRAVLFLVAAAFLVLAFSSVALAATPQDIYDDYAADGSLDGTYTEDELRAYLADSTLDQYYPIALLTDLDALVKTKLEEGHGEFPFTGAQTALMALGVLALLAGGVGLRKLTRSKA